MSAIFRIRNLSRVFGNNPTPSLYVPKLDIPRGQLVALIGRSGCGKTTLLETLGLMSQAHSRTISDSQIVFYPEDGKPGFDYRELWRNSKNLSQIRLEYMSFMFQQANLFPLFDIGDNTVLARMLQGGTYDETMAHVDRRFRQVLPEFYEGNQDQAGNGDSLHRRWPNQLSGGQQQRVVFVRAIMKQSCVLFADEPTGNVGQQDARSIMELIRDHIDQSKDPHKGRLAQTTILVTHDVPLAMDYADQIIVINRRGYIPANHVFESKLESGKRIWPDLKDGDISDRMDSTEMPDLSDIINRTSAEEEIREVASVSSMASSSDHTFKRFYNKHPNKELSLKTINGLILSVVLFIAFMAIGFSKGGMVYLQDKMKDPFVNWVDTTRPRGTNASVASILDSLRTDSAKERFMVNMVNGFYEVPLTVWDPHRMGTYPVWGRTIGFEDPVLERIVDPESLQRKQERSFESANDLGLIISRDLAEQFLKTPDDPFLSYSYRSGDGYAQVPLPIIAVVNDIPGNYEFVMTKYLYGQIIAPDAPLHPRHTKGLKMFVPGDKQAAYEVRDSLIAAAGALNIRINKNLEPSEYNRSYLPGHTLFIRMREHPRLLDQVWEKIQDLPVIQSMQCVRLYDNRLNASSDLGAYDRISINLGDLNGIRALKTYLLEVFSIDIDMAKVEALDNYNFVTKLTTVTSAVIILISIISVSIFVSYILYMHLYKNRVYIGSFKAFGMTDALIRTLYISRMARFIIHGILVSLVATIILGFSGSIREIMSLFYTTVESDYLYFDIFNLYPVIFIVVMGILSYISLHMTAQRFLDHSPGDLIYDRMGRDKRTSPPLRIQKQNTKTSS